MGGFKFLEDERAAPAPAAAKGFQFLTEEAPSAPVESPAALRPSTGTFVSNPGGAAVGRTEIPDPRYMPPSAGDPKLLRLGLETGGAVAGETVGRRFGGLPGGSVGAGVGAGAASLVSNVFDPLTDPLQEARETAITAGGATLLLGGTVAGFRRAIGKPNEAGEWLVAQAEKTGTVPPLGAVMPDSALVRTIQSIGQADILTGKRITDALERTKGQMTDEVRAYVMSYSRSKLVADHAFKQWDDLLEKTVGSRGLVRMDQGTFEASLPLIKGWESLGLLSKLDKGLVTKIKAAEAAGEGILPVLSITEAEAARTLFYRASMEAAKSPANARRAVEGGDYSKAYRALAQDVGNQMDDAVGRAVKDGRMPLDARAQLQGARDLWSKWKQGEMLIDELTLPLQSAAREGAPLASGDVFSALDRIAKTSDKVGKRLVSKDQEAYLAGIGQAMRQAEKSEAQKAFSWVVRAGQLSLFTGGGLAAGATVGGPVGLAVGGVIAATPAMFSWITTNPTAARLVMRGLTLEAGTAEAARVAKQLLVLGIKDKIFPAERPERIEESGRVRSEMDAAAAARAVPD